MRDETTAVDGTDEAPRADVPGLSDIDAQLAVWREQGVDKRSPARFHRIEALARRRNAYDADVRRVLDERLAVLVDAFTQALAADVQATSSAASPSALAALTADITQRIGAAERPATSAAPRTLTPAKPATPGVQAAIPTPRPARSSEADNASAAPVRRPAVAPTPVAMTPTVIATDDAFEDLDVLEYFRETWSKLSTDGNLRQSLAQVPENAGPLNSSHLVHRALSLMHDVSPDYLRHFLRHADALSWLEDMETAGVLGNKSAARAGVVAKPSRTKAR